MNALLELEGIRKSFFGVEVLKGISLEVRKGAIVGLAGENGAGKSTLMNILGGNLRADAGQMRINGSIYKPATAKDARKAGIGFVHQELNLFPNLSIAENLFITNFPRAGSFIHKRELKEKAATLLKRVGFEIDPATLVENLSTGERQLVEIAHALSFDAQLIILDEPTTSLSNRESENLFRLIQQLRGEGRAIIYISHALGDLLRICDELFVLRDGELAGKGVAKDFTMEHLVSLMVGRTISNLYPVREKTPLGDAALTVQNVTQPGLVRDISFTLHKGEVLGIAGLMGAGRTELARILFGLDPLQTGTVDFAGQCLTNGPRERIRNGMAFVTESRREDGLCMDASIAENASLAGLRRFTRGLVVDFGKISKAVSSVLQTVRLQSRASLEQPAKTLSGGNQQKVVLGKWLLNEPKVLILDEPTRGIDVGAKFEIYQLILQLADAGTGVLVISSEIEELIGICDRLLVMNKGRISAEFTRVAFDRERILAAALPEGAMV